MKSQEFVDAFRKHTQGCSDTVYVSGQLFLMPQRDKTKTEGGIHMVQQNTTKNNKRKRYNRRRAHKLWITWIPIFAVIACVLIANNINSVSDNNTSSASDFTQTFFTDTKYNVADENNGWNLILVNRDNYIPDDYAMELTELSNGQKVDSRIYPELQEMFDTARAEGYGLFVAEGYRPREKQQRLLDEKIEAYKSEGYSESESRRLAEQWVAVPGTSEHELGIAVDINADTSKSSSDEVYNWLAENAHKYGFIKRYPSDKTDITGIINEPWHYRYVGKEAAQKIYSQGICLEEYIEQITSMPEAD